MEGIKGFKQLESNHLVKELLAFIDQELPGFMPSEEFISILQNKKNENQHTLSFCVFMTNKCFSRFYFARENAQKGSSVVDIGVYYGANLIFTIEAKILPIPQSGKTNSRDEHEYVYGKGAGIQRFKEERHGVDNKGCLLAENGMIAFLKERDANYWLQKVNNWIIEANWPQSEMLELIKSETLALLRSKHTRANTSELTLHHFWISLHRQ